MRFEYWITEAIDTYSEYEMLPAFPRQQWLRERASMLPYTNAHRMSCRKQLKTYFLRPSEAESLELQ